MKTFPPLNSALIGLARAPPTLALGLAPPPQKKSETTPRDLRNVGYYYPDPIQVCREIQLGGDLSRDDLKTNWAKHGNIFAAPPNPAASITSIGNLFHSDTPVQVGTNRDWTAVESTWNGIVAVRWYGSLWGWGNYQVQINGAWTMLEFSQPTQLCAETNWLGLTAPLASSSHEIVPASSGGCVAWELHSPNPPRS